MLRQLCSESHSASAFCKNMMEKSHAVPKITEGSGDECMEKITILSFLLHFRSLKSSQGHGFSSGHVQMRELDCEEG